MPEATPLQLVACAAGAGFDYGGMWVEIDDWTPQLLRDVKSALQETGLPLIDVEVVWLKPGAADPNHLRIVDIGKELGARNILCVSSDPDRGATQEKLACLAEHAGDDIRINLEFGLFTEVKTINEAAAIIKAIGHPAMGLLVDALHWKRSGGSVAEVAAVPREWLNYVQLCDAPEPGVDPCDPQAILAEAIDGRMSMGRGGLPLSTLLDQLPFGIPISIEERSRALREGFPDLQERAAELYRTSRAWLNWYLDSHII